MSAVITLEQKTFGEYLDHLIEEAGKDPREVALDIQVAPKYVDQLIADQRPPGIRSMTKLAELLEIPEQTLWNEYRTRQAFKTLRDIGYSPDLAQQLANLPDGQLPESEEDFLSAAIFNIKHHRS